MLLCVARNYGEDATIYAGDLKREESILEWMLVQKDPNQEVQSKHLKSNDYDSCLGYYKKSVVSSVFIFKKSTH